MGRRLSLSKCARFTIILIFLQIALFGLLCTVVFVSLNAKKLARKRKRFPEIGLSLFCEGVLSLDCTSSTSELIQNRKGC